MAYSFVASVEGLVVAQIAAVVCRPAISHMLSNALTNQEAPLPELAARLHLLRSMMLQGNQFFV